MIFREARAPLPEGESEWVWMAHDAHPGEDVHKSREEWEVAWKPRGWRARPAGSPDRVRRAREARAMRWAEEGEQLRQRAKRAAAERSTLDVIVNTPIGEIAATVLDRRRAVRAERERAAERSKPFELEGYEAARVEWAAFWREVEAADPDLHARISAGPVTAGS